jgi:hypothetical protein
LRNIYCINQFFNGNVYRNTLLAAADRAIAAAEGAVFRELALLARVREQYFARRVIPQYRGARDPESGADATLDPGSRYRAPRNDGLANA